MAKQILPLHHPCAQVLFRGQQVANNRDRVRAGIETGLRIYKGDASNGNERPRRQDSDRAKALDAYSRVRAFFGHGGADGTESYVVDWLRFRSPHLIGVMGGVADDGVLADNAAGIDRRQVFLPQMQTGAENRRVIGAIVQNEARIGLPAQFDDLLCLFEDAGAPERFMTELEDAGAALKKGFGCEDGINTEAIQ